MESPFHNPRRRDHDNILRSIIKNVVKLIYNNLRVIAAPIYKPECWNCMKHSMNTHSFVNFVQRFYLVVVNIVAIKQSRVRLKLWLPLFVFMFLCVLTCYSCRKFWHTILSVKQIYFNFLTGFYFTLCLHNNFSLKDNKECQICKY